MECGCKGTVAEIDTEEELEERRAEWDSDFKERKKTSVELIRTVRAAIVIVPMSSSLWPISNRRH